MTGNGRHGTFGIPEKDGTGAGLHGIRCEPPQPGGGVSLVW